MTHARKHSARSDAARPFPRLSPEPLERRLLMAADKAPEVDAVFVNGTSWTPAFRTYLEDGRDGSAQFGYEADGQQNKAIIPWVNINQISVQFSEPVTGVDASDLQIESATGEDYVVTGVVYDAATNTATFSLAEPISAGDILSLTIDSAAVTDATGNGLKADFTKDLPVLPGDADQSGEVTPEDTEGVFARFLTSTEDARVDTGPDRAKYSIFFDVDGSGRILAFDYAEVLQREGDSLP